MIRTTLTRSGRTRLVARAAPTVLSHSGLRGRRRGVTLVEMLVATAMCIVGMWMLTWMFQQATASFSLANAQATLTGHERLVTTLMTRDIDQDRFPEDESQPNRGRRLSDLRGQQPRRGGYFLANSKAAQADANNVNVLEGPTPIGPPPATGYTDLYTFGSSRSADHFISFTTILQDTPGNRYYANGQKVSNLTAAPTLVQWNTAGVAAEISYYLRGPTGTTPTGVRLYDLMRVQRIVAQGQYDRAEYERDIVIPGYMSLPPTYPAPTPVDNVHEVMACARANPVAGIPNDRMYTLFDLGNDPTAVWTRGPRFTPGLTAARGTNSQRFGEDRLMSNVVSMEIKFTTPSPHNFGPVAAGNKDAWPRTSATTPPSPNMWPRPLLDDPTNRVEYPAGYQGNSDYPFDNLPFDGRFDTSDFDGSLANVPPNVMTGTAPGSPTRAFDGRRPFISGVQIRIRAFANGTTRQTTLTLSL